jgi:eukaryotic-like serine/threonine-protein kinase
MDAGLQPGTRVAGHLLLRRLGEGAQSQVFLAERLADHALVALKLAALGSAATAVADSFLQHARLAVQLKHPHIVAVLGAGVEGPLAWLAMEAVPGTDLQRYTHLRRLLPTPLVVSLCQRVASALEHAHRQGVVHRDVKPANVLLDWASHSVKLADFGLARAGGDIHTGTGIVLGTPAYMAPELLAGGPPSPSSDLYALGVLMHELLSGRRPFESERMGELLRQVAQDPPPMLPARMSGTPAALQQLLLSLLAKQPRQRPANAGVVTAQLQQLQTLLQGPQAGDGSMSR